MFVNCSNHRSTLWCEKQLVAANEFGEVVDVSFPSVDPICDEEEIKMLARKLVDKIIKLKPDVVMCQGEFTLTYAVVNMLKEEGIVVVAACSQRSAVEKINEDGKSERISIFEFVKFRRY